MKNKTIYVFTFFENPFYGLRDERNRLEYEGTLIVKTKRTAEGFINRYLKTEGLKITEKSKSFSGINRHIDLQQIKV